jgi:hypothetical protein
MITWQQPNIRGEMLFTARTQQSSITTLLGGGITGRSTTAETIDVTGTTITWSDSFTLYQTGTNVITAGTNTLVQTTTSTNSNSASSYFTSANLLIPETSTTVSATVFVRTTSSTTYETSAWTSALLGSGTATTVSFVSTDATFNDIGSYATESTTVLTTKTITNTEGVVANVHDTVVLCKNSQVAMMMTSYTNLSDWNGSGIAATNTTTGTILTIPPQVSSKNVSLHNFTAPTFSQAQQTVTFSKTYERVTQSSQTTLYEYFYSVLPNETISYTRPINSIITSQTQQTLTLESSFSHVANTQTIKFFYRLPQTSIDVLLDGRTMAGLSQLSPYVVGEVEQIAFQTVTTSNNITHATGTTSNRTIEAGGNSTFLETKHLQLACREQENIIGYGYNNRNVGQAWIVKPYGVVGGSISGGFATISDTTFTESHMVYLSRHVPFLNFDVPRALRSLAGSSNNSFTIQDGTITYTVTGSEKTTSQQISIEGEYQTGVVATKFVLGGEPEQSATIYQSAPRGVFSILKDQQATTTLMNGEHSVIAYPQTSATSVMLPIPYVTATGGPLLDGRVLVFHNQVIPRHSAEEYE